MTRLVVCLGFTAFLTLFSLHPPSVSGFPVPAPPFAAGQSSLALFGISEEEWPEEAWAMQLEAVLGRLAAASYGTLEFQTLLNEMVSSRFRGGFPFPSRTVAAPADWGELLRGEISGEQGAGKEEYIRDFSRRREKYRSIRAASFRLLGMDAHPEAERAAAKVHFEIAGETEGGPRQESGQWRMEWTREAGEWRLTGAALLDYRGVRSSRFFFEDISSFSLAGNSSFDRQLNRGTGHWTRVLDGASQVDFYGLNGLAVADYDGDGWEDVYVCQPGGLPNRLLRNRGDGTFEDVTAQAGLAVLDPTSAALWADYDNNGFPDLFVITPGEILLFENDGKGRFRRSEKARFEIEPSERGALVAGALADYDRDGFLDLYVVQYSPAARSGMPDSLHQPTPYHDANNGPPNQLFRNNGDGTFTNVTKEVGLSVNNSRWSFAAAWGDFNGNGYPDLYVANDFGKNNLYRNNGDGTFTDIAERAGVEDVAAGMSVAWEDYDNDGRLDLYVSNIWSPAGQRLMSTPNFQPSAEPAIRELFRRFAEGNTLYRNGGEERFQETTFEAGVENGGWAWSSDFLDFNNNGWEDLYVTNGHVTNDRWEDLESFHWAQVVANSPLQAVRLKGYDEAWRAFQNLMLERGFSTHGRERNRFYVNVGDGTFVDVSGLSGLDFAGDSRAFAVLDLDGDGRLDVITKSRTSPQVRVFRNRSAQAQHAVSFELVGRQSNRDAVGARILIEWKGRWRLKEVKAGSGFLSQSSRRVHFGLGDSERISRVRIVWPSGRTQEFTDLPAGHLISIEEGENEYGLRPFRSGLRELRAEATAVEPAASPGSDEGGTWLLDPVDFPDLPVLDLEGEVRFPLRRLGGQPVALYVRDADFGDGIAEEWISVTKELAAGEVVFLLSPAQPEGMSALKDLEKKIPDSSLFVIRRQTLSFLNSLVKHLFVRRRSPELPITLLLDGQGRIVKVYRNRVRPLEIRSDLERLPGSPSERLALALPFPGEYHTRRPPRLESYFLLGTESLRLGLFDEADRYFRRCLEIDPALSSVLSNLGMTYWSQGLMDQALRYFERAAQADPGSAEIQFNIGTSLAMMGEVERAVQTLQKAAEMDPDSAEIWHNLGNAYLDLNQPSLAMPALQRALELNPRDAEVHNSLGAFFGQEGFLGKALEHFQEAVRLNPTFVSPYVNLGLLYLRKGDSARALEMLEKALHLDPEAPHLQQLVEQIR